MATLVIITDPETALGFRLTGVNVEEVAGPSDGSERLLQWFERKEQGVVMYNEGFRTGLTSLQQAMLDDSLTPVFFPLPVERAKPGVEAREEYLARVLRRAIGYQVKLKR